MTPRELSPEHELGPQLHTCKLDTYFATMSRISGGAMGAVVMSVANFFAAGIMSLLVLAFILKTAGATPGPAVQVPALVGAAVMAVIVICLETWARRQPRLVHHQLGIRYRRLWAWKWVQVPFSDLVGIEVSSPAQKQGTLDKIGKVMHPILHAMADSTRRNTVVFHLRNGSTLQAKNLMLPYSPEESARFWGLVRPLLVDGVVEHQG